MKKISVEWVPVKDLKTNPLNRYKEWTGEIFTTNRDSIEQKGILVPLIVKQDKTIVDGHNRRKVAEMLKIDKVPCIIIPDFQDSVLEKNYIDIVQNARRQLNEGDYLKIISEDFKDRIFQDNRGKNKSGQLGEEGDASTYISKRMGIPRSVVHRIILKIREMKQFQRFQNNGGKDLKVEIEKHWDSYVKYTKLIEKRSKIRREVVSMENELKEIADLQYWKQVAKEKEGQ